MLFSEINSSNNNQIGFSFNQNNNKQIDFNNNNQIDFNKNNQINFNLNNQIKQNNINPNKKIIYNIYLSFFILFIIIFLIYYSLFYYLLVEYFYFKKYFKNYFLFQEDKDNKFVLNKIDASNNFNILNIITIKINEVLLSNLEKIVIFDKINENHAIYDLKSFFKYLNNYKLDKFFKIKDNQEFLYINNKNILDEIISILNYKINDNEKILDYIEFKKEIEINKQIKINKKDLNDLKFLFFINRIIGIMQNSNKYLIYCISFLILELILIILLVIYKQFFIWKKIIFILIIIFINILEFIFSDILYRNQNLNLFFKDIFRIFISKFIKLLISLCFLLVLYF